MLYIVKPDALRRITLINWRKIDCVYLVFAAEIQIVVDIHVMYHSTTKLHKMVRK